MVKNYDDGLLKGILGIQITLSSWGGRTLLWAHQSVHITSLVMSTYLKIQPSLSVTLYRCRILLRNNNLLSFDLLKTPFSSLLFIYLYSEVR